MPSTEPTRRRARAPGRLRRARRLAGPVRAVGLPGAGRRAPVARAPAPAPARDARARARAGPAPYMRPARTVDEYKRQMGVRLIAANPGITYTKRAPDMLMGIPILEVEVNADGSVRHISVMRTPRGGHARPCRSPSTPSGAPRRSATPRRCPGRGSSCRCSCSTTTGTSSPRSSTEAVRCARTLRTPTSARHALQGRMARCSSRSPLC